MGNRSLKWTQVDIIALHAPNLTRVAQLAIPFELGIVRMEQILTDILHTLPGFDAYSFQDIFCIRQILFGCAHAAVILQTTTTTTKN